VIKLTLNSNQALTALLEQLFERYHRTEFLGSDPLEFPHRFSDPWEQEAVALIAALLSYGNVKQIRRSVQAVLDRIGRTGKSPREWVTALGRPGGLEEGLEVFEGFVHRFNSGTDMVILLALIARTWKEWGSVGALFVSALEPEDADISRALDALVATWRAWVQSDPALRRLARKSPSYSYLMTSPEDGSCCKRWCMFLRWVGRVEKLEGRLDLGLWAEGSELARKTFSKGRALRASQLVIPLDTHTGRISQYIGLTRRKTLNWLAALEVTEALRACDRDDPTKYDFALARLGILDVCLRRYRSEICSRCSLVTACRFARAGRKKEKTKEKTKEAMI
jgi:uncharacterized protein (TIGR02757 family)